MNTRIPSISAPIHCEWPGGARSEIFAFASETFTAINPHTISDEALRLDRAVTEL